jgi:hypothetical protein
MSTLFDAIERVCMTANILDSDGKVPDIRRLNSSRNILVREI